MSIQPINSVSVAFTGKIKTTDKGNTYETSNVGKGIGFVSGLAIAGALRHGDYNYSWWPCRYKYYYSQS